MAPMSTMKGRRVKISTGEFLRMTALSERPIYGDGHADL
jgi:hypothetical protein